MTAKWDQIKEIVATALEQSPDQRDSFVHSACGEDEELRLEVESLLSHSDAADTVLENPPALDMLALPADAMVGRQIGSYRIVGQTGQGGMAVVYLAERADQEFRRRVAIKMLKPGCDQGEVLRRFRNERQTLAALDHPNIVKLLDGGATDTGLPYLVMEFVEGVAITQHCDDHRLPISDRLRLFRTVCEAVEYAHCRGVIHRDLKPSNILVTRDGTPRLLDFGIAKLLNPECLQTELVTRTEWRPMTPEYASPEQLRGEPVTERADIYSLGVLLYELLTGRRPYQHARPSWPEGERMIHDSEPRKASVAIGTTEAIPSQDGAISHFITPEQVSFARSIKTDDLRRCLRGDLDIILTKALRLEPQDRYASANELAGDIEAHVSGLPIKAKKPTLVYRGAKLLRKHRESAFVALAMLALTAGLGIWAARRLGKPNPAGQQFANVHIRARPALAMLGFKNRSGRSDTAWVSTALTEIFAAQLAAGEQLRMVPGESVARTLTDLRLSDVESIPPDRLAQVRKNLGTDFVVVGSYSDQGEDKPRRIRLDLRVQDAQGKTVATASEEGTETAILDFGLQVGARLRDQFGLRKLSPVESTALTAELPSNPDAIPLYSQGLAHLRNFDALGARDLLSRVVAVDSSFALAHSALANAWVSLGYDANATQEAKRALDLGNNLSREKHLLVEAAYQEATKNWPKAMEAYQTLFSFFPDNVEYGLDLVRVQSRGGQGKNALNTLVTLTNSRPETADDPRIDLARAEAASYLGDDRLRRDAADMAASKAGKQGARLLVARARAIECRALANLGENDRARPVCEEARQIYSDVGDRSGLSRTLHAMAEIPINQGDLVTAQHLYEQALSLAREVGDQQAMAREFLNLGVVYRQQGNFARSRSMYDLARRTYEKAGDKAGTLLTIGNTANLLHEQGSLAEAHLLYKRALALSEEVGNQSSVAIAKQNIAELLAERGDLAGALLVGQQALDTLRAGGQQHYYAGALVIVGQILQQQGDLDRARKTYVEAQSLMEQLGEKGAVADVKLAIANLNCDEEKPVDAESETLSALPEFAAEKDRNEQARAQTVLSHALLQQGKLKEAEQAVVSALKLSESGTSVAIRLATNLQNARVREAKKEYRQAEHTAQLTMVEAGRLGFVGLQLESSLVLGKIQIRHGNQAAGRARLAKLKQDADAKGFGLLAKKALAPSGSTLSL